MNDRCKYRIPMFTDKGHFIEYQYIELGEPIECTLCGKNGEPEQCTGLHDKNGKLIYEGDVLKTVFDDGSSSTRTIVYLMDEARYYLAPFPMKEFPIYWDCKQENVQFFEIIGNIHEMEVTE